MRDNGFKQPHVALHPEVNIICVTHGLTLRLFLMRWFQYTVEEFEESWNPENTGTVVMERIVDAERGAQWYECEQETLEPMGLVKREYIHHNKTWVEERHASDRRERAKYADEWASFIGKGGNDETYDDELV